jgi:hypothetical protein
MFGTEVVPFKNTSALHAQFTASLFLVWQVDVLINP